MNDDHEPIVKAYGIVSFTKRRYVRTQVVMIGLTIASVIASFAWTPPAHWQKNPILGHLPAILLGALVLEVVEAALMLRKFAAKERARGRGRQN